jgi:hypothetical protein
MAHSCHAQSRNPALSVRKISAQFAACRGQVRNFCTCPISNPFLGLVTFCELDRRWG